MSEATADQIALRNARRLAEALSDENARLSKKLRVIVCGGRTYGVMQACDHALADDCAYCAARRILVERERGYMQGVLDALKPTIDILAHGAASGADTFAGVWAVTNFIAVRGYPADWRKYGNGAGPIRNREMLKDFKPEMVLAFPGGVGTTDMITISRAAGIVVREMRP